MSCRSRNCHDHEEPKSGRPPSPDWISRSSLGPPPTTVTPREGIVRPLGRSYRDDTGFFHPKGCTFFWAMQGERHKTAKFEKHLDYLVEREHRPDEIRILAEVDWPGWGIDPYDADYERILGNVLDKAYVRGLRSQITLIGGEEGDALYRHRDRQGGTGRQCGSPSHGRVLRDCERAAPARQDDLCEHGARRASLAGTTGAGAPDRVELRGAEAEECA